MLAAARGNRVARVGAVVAVVAARSMLYTGMRRTRGNRGIRTVEDQKCACDEPEELERDLIFHHLHLRVLTIAAMITLIQSVVM